MSDGDEELRGEVAGDELVKAQSWVHVEWEIEDEPELLEALWSPFVLPTVKAGDTIRACNGKTRAIVTYVDTCLDPDFGPHLRAGLSKEHRGICVEDVNSD